MKSFLDRRRTVVGVAVASGVIVFLALALWMPVWALPTSILVAILVQQAGSSLADRFWPGSRHERRVMGKKPKGTWEPTKKNLSHAPRLVVYEIEMFLDSLWRWMDHRRGTKKLDARGFNSAVEGTHLHGRNLIVFFRGNPETRKDDDVYSDDCGFPLHENVVPPEVLYVINKRCEHLTYARADTRMLEPEAFFPVARLCKAFINDPTCGKRAAKHDIDGAKERWHFLKAFVDGLSWDNYVGGDEAQTVPMKDG